MKKRITVFYIMLVFFWVLFIKMPVNAYTSEMENEHLNANDLANVYLNVQNGDYRQQRLFDCRIVFNKKWDLYYAGKMELECFDTDFKKFYSSSTDKGYLLAKSKKFYQPFQYRVTVRFGTRSEKLRNSINEVGMIEENVLRGYAWGVFVPGAKLVRFRSVGDKKVKITWNKIIGAKYYQVWYKKGKNGKWKCLKRKEKTTSTIVKLTKSKQKQYFYVRPMKVNYMGTYYEGANPKNAADVFIMAN